MVTEFCFEAPDKPGELSKVATVLGSAGVNIDGLSASSAGSSTTTFRLVVDNEEAARSALDTAGIPFSTNEAFLLGIANRPGALGELSSKLGDAGVNITSFYVTMDGKQVLSVDDVEAAKGLVHG